MECQHEKSAGRKIVLVVEDDLDVREVTGHLLTQLGFEVKNADHASAALTLLDGGEQVDLLFADVGLPSGMNGAELVNEVRRRYPDLKSLLVTAYDEKALRAYGAYATGANILNKPYGKEQLATAIEACMSKI
ncbi:MAG: response regulator [SAR324 cluster bacterium]|nr:response regulator [SAR324 cluster bacterium]